ncbi:hypothetical protein [Nonomuraea rubra]|uniref:hypothetical protein n=1 Tax=Nonomuraea rubra TaxID=46180 RepID=UPI0036202205
MSTTGYGTCDGTGSPGPSRTEKTCSTPASRSLRRIRNLFFAAAHARQSLPGSPK